MSASFASTYACMRAYSTKNSASLVGDYVKEIEHDLGGVSRELLNHRDKASRFCVLDAPVFCHATEKGAIESKGCRVGETYFGKTMDLLFGNGGELLAYHTPGHSVGVTSYLWKPAAHRTSASVGANDAACHPNYDHMSSSFSVLFTGDTLHRDSSGKFALGPLTFHAYPGNRQDMIQTLQLYRRLEPTPVVSGLMQSENFVSKYDA